MEKQYSFNFDTSIDDSGLNDFYDGEEEDELDTDSLSIDDFDDDFEGFEDEDGQFANGDEEEPSLDADPDDESLDGMPPSDEDEDLNFGEEEPSLDGENGELPPTEPEPSRRPLFIFPDFIK